MVTFTRTIDVEEIVCLNYLLFCWPFKMKSKTVDEEVTYKPFRARIINLLVWLIIGPELE